MKASLGRLSCVVSLASFALLAGCGKKDSSNDPKSGKLLVKLSNTTPTALTAGTKPATFKVRVKLFIIGNYDETNNTWAGGKASMVYQHPACTNVTVDATTGASYGDIASDADCATKMQAEADGGYIDLAAGSNAINDAVKAQAAKVQTGTYTHLGFALLGEQQSGQNTFENLSWTHSSVTGTQTYALKKVEYLKKLDTPLEVKEGETVTATVAYDLSTALTTLAQTDSNETTSCAVDASGTTKSCVTLPTFTVSATTGN